MKFSEIKADDLNRSKLNLISFGSIGGMGIGLLLSLLFNTPTLRLIVAIILMCTAGWACYKSLPYMVIE